MHYVTYVMFTIPRVFSIFPLGRLVYYFTKHLFNNPRTNLFVHNRNKNIITQDTNWNLENVQTKEKL